MKRVATLFVFFLVVLCVAVGCKNNEITSEKQNNRLSTNENAEAIVEPLIYDSRRDFVFDIAKERKLYEEKKEESEHKLYKIDSYFEFELCELPEDISLEKITVAPNCEYVDVAYKIDDCFVDIFWFLAIDDPDYDFVADTSNIYSDYEKKMIKSDDCEILEIYHPKSPKCIQAYYQYTFVKDGNNLEISVPEELVNKYGNERFLKVRKNTIDFESLYAELEWEEVICPVDDSLAVPTPFVENPSNDEQFFNTDPTMPPPPDKNY